MQTAKTLAKSCDNRTAANCGGYAAASLLGAKGAGAALKGAKAGGRGGQPPCANSFVTGTLVRMAGGTLRPIEQIAVGDRVLGFDERTGRTGGYPVTALIEGVGAKRLVSLTIDGSTTVATQNHPYWETRRGAWVDAGRLRPGDRVRRDDGTTAVVEHVRTFAVLTGVVHNLSVDEVHTYYAGQRPVLVHNCARLNPETLTAAEEAALKARADGKPMTPEQKKLVKAANQKKVFNEKAAPGVRNKRKNRRGQDSR